jgi:alkanesulfonate monooxygenase SsuD/methylene tetrahydromethanopterin reductase-like flavin-dependent oxidoreductase (luciferase family)
VRLTTAVLLAPLRRNPALFAKQAASLDRLSNGRLVLGLAVGGRPDDFEASGVDVHRRARDMDALLEMAQRIWSGESFGVAGAIGPQPARPGGVQIIIGGQAPASLRRAAKYGAGWVAGGGGAQRFREAVEPVRQAWSAAGRTDKPRLMGLAYFALGPDAKAHAEKNLRQYYAFAGPYADMVVQSALVSDDAVRQAVAEYEAAGCDELMLSPCDPDLGQVDALAEVVVH